MRPRYLVIALLICTPAAAAAQQDEPGCKDHPLFNRMPNHYIERCESVAFDARNYPVAPEKPGGEPRLVEIEGAFTLIVYRPAEDAKPPSPLQIQRNFQNAAKAAGGTVQGSFPAWCDFQLDESFQLGNACTDRGTTLTFAREGRETWVFVNATSFGHTGSQDGYVLYIMEREAMAQDIRANELLEALERDGMIALYLHFETGSAAIQASSHSQLDQIAAMLKSAPNMALEVAGHTDNVGNADANQKLSEARAAAVVKALAERGVAAARLSAAGYGQTQPIADNRTEEGRAKNRRVELVKKK